VRFVITLGGAKVHETDSEASALMLYNVFVKRSLEWSGKCGGKPVTLTRDGETIAEHAGST